MYKIMTRFQSGLVVMYFDRLTREEAESRMARALEKNPQGQYWIECDV